MSVSSVSVVGDVSGASYGVATNVLLLLVTGRVLRMCLGGVYVGYRVFIACQVELS